MYTINHLKRISIYFPIINLGIKQFSMHSCGRQHDSFSKFLTIRNLLSKNKVEKCSHLMTIRFFGDSHQKISLLKGKKRIQRKKKDLDNIGNEVCICSYFNHYQ